MTTRHLIAQNLRVAKHRWGGNLSRICIATLQVLSEEFRFSVAMGDLLLLENNWYVTHAGLIRLARRSKCFGVDVRPATELTDPAASRWAFKATVYRARGCRGFVGYGDADPSNVSPLVQGAEMRVAETRAVNRALRKAYGIGVCSIEEIGALPSHGRREPNARKLPPQMANANGGPKLRDQLRLLIRQHRLDPEQVKQYVTEFCGTKDIRKASREQIQSFITHLAELVTKDPGALLCKLNSYAHKPEEGAA